MILRIHSVEWSTFRRCWLKIINISERLFLPFFADETLTYKVPVNPSRHMHSPLALSQDPPVPHLHLCRHPFPKVPGGHDSSQYFPMYPGGHWHVPLTGSQRAPFSHLHCWPQPGPQCLSSQAGREEKKKKKFRIEHQNYTRHHKYFKELFLKKCFFFPPSSTALTLLGTLTPGRLSLSLPTFSNDHNQSASSKTVRELL